MLGTHQLYHANCSMPQNYESPRFKMRMTESIITRRAAQRAKTGTWNHKSQPPKNPRAYQQSCELEIPKPNAEPNNELPGSFIEAPQHDLPIPHTPQRFTPQSLSFFSTRHALNSRLNSEQAENQKIKSGMMLTWQISRKTDGTVRALTGGWCGEAKSPNGNYRAFGYISMAKGIEPENIPDARPHKRKRGEDWTGIRKYYAWIERTNEHWTRQPSTDGGSLGRAKKCSADFAPSNRGDLQQ